MNTSRHDLEARLDRACEAVRTALQGARNGTLRSQARLVGGLLHLGIQEAVAADALQAAAVAAGLKQSEARATIAHALRSGAAAPIEAPRRGGNGRPWRAQPRPAPAPLPPIEDLAPPIEAQGVLTDLWAHVAGEPLAPAVVQWATGRALCPDAMHDHGARSPSLELLRRLWSTHGGPAMQAAGLARIGAGGKPRPAWRYQSSETVTRVWVPVWSPVWTAAPVAWRWRACGASEVKSLGAKTTDHAWRRWPLGVRWANSTWQGDRSHPDPVVVIVEGEPDFWTVAATVEPGGEVYGMPGTVDCPAQWWPLFRPARLVIMALHEDKAGRGCAARMSEAIHQRATIEGEAPPPIVTIAPPPGGDWNDALQRQGIGALRPLSDAVQKSLQQPTRGRT